MGMLSGESILVLLSLSSSNECTSWYFNSFIDTADATVESEVDNLAKKVVALIKPRDLIIVK